MADIQEFLAILDVEPTNAQALAGLERLAAAGDAGISTPTATRALAEARRIHRDRGDLELVARLLDVELAAEKDTARRADLLFEKGKLLAEDLLNEDAAIECFHRVLELRPDDENALEVLANIDLVRSNWEKIVQKYVEEARVQTDRQLTTSLYLSAAETWARYRPDAPEVEEYLRRALEIEPRNRRAATHLERLLRKAGRWQELAQFLRQRIDAAATRDERLQALLGLADVAKSRLGDPALSVECMKKVLALDPSHPRAIRALIEVYSAEENWGALVKVYEGALKTRRPGQGPEAELATYLQIAMLHWKRLGQLDAAEEYFRRIRKLDPAHAAMLDFYREYHRGRGEEAKLLQVLQAAHKAEPDPARRAALGVEIASLAEGAIGNPEKAIDSWKAILRADPKNAEARAALKRLYEKTEKWNALLELLKEEIEAIPIDTEEGKKARVELLLDVVAIYLVRLNLDVMVINTYNNILALIPDHRGALEALAQKYEQLGRWNDLITVLWKKAEAKWIDPIERKDTLRRIATLWTDRFGNHAQAVRPLEELLAIDPSDREASARLKEIYAKRRQWRGLLDLLSRETDTVPPERRHAHLAEMAKIAAERLGDSRAAMAIWNRLLEEHPDDAEALASLAILYEREKRWLALAEIYHRQRALIGDVDRAAAIAVLERLGTLYAEKLEAPRLAAQAFEEILSLEPRHPKATRVLRDLLAQAMDLEGLERLYGRLGAWDDLLDVLHAIADRAPSHGEKLAILRRIARLAAEKSLSPEKAARAHERILSIDPHDVEAARALVPIYRDGAKWARLLSTYEVLLAHAEDAGDKLRLLIEIRQLCEEKLGSKALAFQWGARAWEVAPAAERDALMADLLRLGAEADAWEQVAEILARRVASDEVGDAEKLRLWRELGRIRAIRLHRPDDARAAWEQVLALAPDDVEALGALEELAAQQARWPDLLAIYRRRAELEDNVERRLEMLFKIAFIEEERVGDLDGAARTYEKILQLRPKNPRALRALAKVNGARGDAAGLARALEWELETAEDGEAKVQIMLRLGSLYEEKLGQRRRALEHYEACLALQPTNRQVHAALERFLAPGMEERALVARKMAPIYERAEEPAKLAQTLEILRAAETDPAERLATDRRLVSLYARRLRDPLNAYEAATRVLLAAPDDADNRRELFDLAAELEAHDDLARQLEKALAGVAAAGDARTQRELAEELAALYDERLGQATEAEIAWRKVLELDPGHERAYDALERILRAQARWDDLRELLSRREAHTLDAARKLDILVQICDLYEGVLENPVGAIEAYRRVLELDPGQIRAYKSLERLYEAEKRWSDLEDLLGREVAHVKEPREIVELTYRRALVRAARLGDAIGACDLAEEVLARDPGFPGARMLLEELFARPELRLRIARLLVPLYEADGLWVDVVRMLRGERELAAGGPETVEILARIARIQEERLGDEEAAFATWVEALMADPGEREVREALERLARRLGRWKQAADAWEEALERTPVSDVGLRATLLSEVAAIYDRCLGDVALAIGAYRRLFELDPANVEAMRRAADALERLYEGEEDWPRLIEILRRQTEWLEAERRTVAFQRIARIQEERLGDKAAAVATWRELLLEDPDGNAALDALERLHAERGEHRDLVEILRRRVERQADARGKRDLLLRIAELEERELGDAAGAILTYLEVLDFAPDDRQALRELARLYRAGERWVDLVEVDERRLALASDPDEQTVLTYELGLLLRDRLGRAEEALERFREILAAHPPFMAADESPRAQAIRGALSAVEAALGDETLKLRAAEILRPIYEATSDFAKLVALYEMEAAATEDVRDKIARLRRVAELRERNLLDPDGALDAYTRACRTAIAEPDLRDLLAAVQRLAIDRDRVADLIALYRELAPDVLDPDLQRSMYLDVADLARGKLQDGQLAKEYYRRVLDAHPDDARALTALERLAREMGEWEPLREILARKVERSEDLDEKREALVEIALLCEEKLGLAEEAVAAWEQVLELSPADGDAARALERLYTTRERWIELAELFERRLGFAADVAEAVDLRYRLGVLYAERLTDPDRAVENFEAALSGDPQHAGAIAALERYLDDPATRLSVAAVLEPVYIARQDWPKLIRIAEIQLDAETDPERRLALTKRVARLYEEQLEDLEGAFRWYGKVFREDPDDRAIRDQLFRLAQILERWDGLAHIYQEFLDDQAGDGPAVREVARVLAEIYDRRLGDVERARLAYKRLLEATPDDLDAFQRLEAMLTRAGRWFVLIESYEQAIEAAIDAGRRKDLYRRIAGVQETRLDALDKAIDAYRAILDLDADDEAAAIELDRLLVAQKRWQELAELLATRAERAPDPAAAASLRLRLAEVLEHKLSDDSGAINQYERVVADDPTNATALSALERLVQREEHRERIAAILEPIYRKNDWWQKLVVILDARLEFIDDGPRRIEVLREIARLHETRGGAMTLALRALARAWKEDVASEEVFAEMYRVAEKLGAWEDLVATIDSGVEGIYDYDLAARLLGRIGQIEEEKRQDRGRAIAAWRRVLEVKEDDAAALDALERLYEAERRFDALVGVLEKKVELAALAEGGEVLARKELLHRIADLHEKALGRRDDAIGAWRRVLELDDEDAAALDALERLYREARDYRALADVLLRKIELSPDPAARRPFHFAAARVLDEELQDVFEAIAQYKAVLEADPTDGEALEALDRLYERERAWADQVEVLDRRTELAADPETRADLAFRAARVVERELGEPDQAIERYRRILELAPRHEATREALEALTRREETLEAAAAVLEPVYRAEGLADRLAALYERRVAAPGADPDRRRSDFAALAEVHETGRGNLAAAFATWARWLREQPEDVGAQAELERLAAARGAWEELATLYAEMLSGSMDPELGRSYALKLAVLYEDAIGDLDRAAGYYRQALELGGDELVPLAALDRIYERQGLWRELADTLAREAHASMSDEDQATFLYRLGDVRERALGDAAGAVEAYRDVLERNPRHEAARTALERLLGNPAQRAAVIQILEPIYEADADHARLADLLEAKLTVEDSAAERATHLIRIAELAERRLHDKVRALDAVGRWLAEDPASELAASELERLAGELGRWEEAAARLADVAEAAADEGTARDLALRLGRILFEKLGDPTRAEAPYRRVLAGEPQHLGALAALERIYRALGDAAKLAEILWRRGEAELDAAVKRAAFAEAARLREERLGDDAGAVVAWRQVLDLEEGDREAHARLAAIFERGRRWEELVELLELAARFAETPEKERQLKTRIATVLADELGALDRAVDAWHAVVDLAPTDEAPLVALAAVQARRGDWFAVQDTLVRRLALAESPRHRIAILAELARIAEVERKSVDEAVGYFHQILEVDNTYAPAYESLERLLGATERYHDLVELLLRHADVRGALGDRDGEIGLLLRAADVWEERLGSPEAAAEILEKVHAREPRHVPTLTRLGRIYEAVADWEKCAEALEKALALGPMGRDAADLHYRLGRVAEARGAALEEVIPHYQRALSFDPSHRQAIAALEQAARDRGDWVEVAGLLARREASETEPAAKLALALELAEIHRSRLGRPAEAIPYLERAARANPDDVTVAESLAELYAAAGRGAEAEPIWRALADRARAARRMKDVARYQQRVGALREAAGDAEGALAAYEEAFKIDPTHGRTMAGLGRLYFAQADWEKARRVYRSMLLQNLDADVGVTKADVYLQLGLIHARLGERPKAKSMYERGLEIDPQHAGLRAALSELG